MPSSPASSCRPCKQPRPRRPALRRSSGRRQGRRRPAASWVRRAAPPACVTHAVGDINSLQSQIPLNDLVANLSQVTTNVSDSNTGLSVASGLTSLPITPLLPPSVTSNETPLNNGTPDLGTVWITPPPVPPGLFHPGITDRRSSRPPDGRRRSIPRAGRRRSPISGRTATRLRAAPPSTSRRPSGRSGRR